MSYRNVETLRYASYSLLGQLMRFRFHLLLPVFCVVIFGCASIPPRGDLSGACTGVPGDGRSPSQFDAPAEPTHGPGGAGEAIEIKAVARPATTNIIPLLYVYDSEEYPVLVHPVLATSTSELLKDPVFANVEADAYWPEVWDDRFYLIPWLDKCSQDSMLKEPLSFAAPPDGLLFMQFIADSCDECAEISMAIEELVASNPELLIRWVQVHVASSIGKLHTNR